MNFFETAEKKRKKAQKPQRFLCFFANTYRTHSQGIKVKVTSQGVSR